MPFITDISGGITGDVSVSPWRVDGNSRVPLDDPFDIFADRSAGREFAQSDASGSVLTLRENLVVNTGRQVMANLLGGRDYPATSWVVSRVRFGSYDAAPAFGDVGISPQPSADPPFLGGENTIPINGSGDLYKEITAVDWPQPFIVRFEIELGLDEANGYLIREMGLFTGNDTLVARKTFVAIAKSSGFGLNFVWRIRT